MAKIDKIKSPDFLGKIMNRVHKGNRVHKVHRGNKVHRVIGEIECIGYIG